MGSLTLLLPFGGVIYMQRRNRKHAVLRILNFSQYGEAQSCLVHVVAEVSAEWSQLQLEGWAGTRAHHG